MNFCSGAHKTDKGWVLDGWAGVVCAWNRDARVLRDWSGGVRVVYDWDKSIPRMLAGWVHLIGRELGNLHVLFFRCFFFGCYLAVVEEEVVVVVVVAHDCGSNGVCAYACVCVCVCVRERERERERERDSEGGRGVGSTEKHVRCYIYSQVLTLAHPNPGPQLFHQEVIFESYRIDQDKPLPLSFTSSSILKGHAL